MSKDEEKKVVYGLFIVRKDRQIMTIAETDNYDEIYDRWIILKDGWSKAVKDQVPFEIIDPIVTVFDPGLINEITIKPVVETTASRHSNPYQKNMVDKGFSNTFGNPEAVADVLDGGYR